MSLKVYFTGRWRGLRRTVPKDNPWCAVEGCHNLATKIDHMTPLCAKHHSEKTTREVWHRKETG